MSPVPDRSVALVRGHRFDAMCHGFAAVPHEGDQLDREVLAFLDRYMT